MNRFAPPEPAPMGVTLQRGLRAMEELSAKLKALDDLMLTGRPHDIADAALDVENTLRAATPAFKEIAAAMRTLGASNLQAAAQKLRASEQAGAAGLVDSLRHALERFAQRSVAANRRAQQLNRGLGNALRSLQALGIEESGRLIAEA